MNRNVYLATSAAFFSAMGFSLISPVIAFHMRYGLMGSGLDVALLTTGFMLARAVSAPLVGYTVTDRHREAGKAVLLASMALFVPISILYIYANSAAALLLLRVVHGFLSGVTWPMMQVIVGMSSPKGGRGWSLGIYFAGGGLGGSIGFKLYGGLGLSEAQLYLLGSALYGLGLASAVFINQPLGPVAKRRGGGRVRADAFLVWILVTAFIIGSMAGATKEFLYVYLREIHGVPKSALGDLLFTSTLAGVAVGLVSGSLSDRMGMGPVLIALMSSSALAAIFLAADIPFLAVMLSMTVIFITIRAARPIIRNVAIAPSLAYAGTAVGLSNTASNLGAAFFPIIAGRIYDVMGGVAALGPISIELKGLAFVVLGALALAVALAFPIYVGGRGEED